MGSIKIAVGMIVFEGDYVLKQCLDQIYPHVDQILVSEGPVSFWQSKGKYTSEDDTNKILDNYYDPNNKLKVIHGQYQEKDDQSNAYTPFINHDIDYLWMIDSDEVYKTEDILKLKEYLLKESPTSVGVQSCTFYGGFSRYLTGFEQATDNFLRIFKFVKGAKWLKHRPPTIQYPSQIQIKHIPSDKLFKDTGIQMYHYSYVFPDQVSKKIGYYATFLKNGNIPNYFQNVYLPWIKGDSQVKGNIETNYQGVHEWVPERRGPCFTSEFLGNHPESIQLSLNDLNDKVSRQLSKWN